MFRLLLDPRRATLIRMEDQPGFTVLTGCRVPPLTCVATKSKRKVVFLRSVRQKVEIVFTALGNNSNTYSHIEWGKREV